ncbi:DUF1934 domain-containing protein [Paenibacillus sp. FSL W8-1187]|uniref:DUF1934 domain-containing protein n=1 Tax=Paenibacillus pasadenensis TaxID=217090 RepID=A0A2N5N067_9BACL|nr:DUF1934 domain-containing protein [Paenibacillus pasadenensis]PLT43737.1 hypothetical protein B8V81_2168 [Paenibacillus pasadenensis]
MERNDRAPAKPDRPADSAGPAGSAGRAGGSAEGGPVARPSPARLAVDIAVSSMQDGKREPAARHRGELIPKGRSLYLRYEERDELHGVVRTTLRWNGEELTLTRRGGLESDQTFAAGQSRGGRYASPHLSFPLVTETEELAASSPGEGLLPLTLSWTYRLRIEDESSGRFQLRLTIQEANQP